jgi:hypothetical protein
MREIDLRLAKAIGASYPYARPGRRDRIGWPFPKYFLLAHRVLCDAVWAAAKAWARIDRLPDDRELIANVCVPQALYDALRYADDPFVGEFVAVAYLEDCGYEITHAGHQHKAYRTGHSETDLEKA